MSILSKGVLLTRHSESVLNKEKRWAGSLDTALTSDGIIAVRRAAVLWQGCNITAVASSNLQRAGFAADYIANSMQVLRVPPDSRLQERYAGLWQGQLVADLASDPIFNLWSENETTCPPKGELYSDFTSRVFASLVDLLNLQGLTLTVAHAGVVNAVCRLKNISNVTLHPLTDAVLISKKIENISYTNFTADTVDIEFLSLSKDVF